MTIIDFKGKGNNKKTQQVFAEIAEAHALEQEKRIRFLEAGSEV